MTLFRSILVAADFSESSLESFRLACSLADEKRTRLSVFHAVRPRYITEHPVYRGQQTVRFFEVERDEACHASLRDRLRAAYSPNRAIDAEYLTEEGDTIEEILRAAEERGCDLIVMGTHGRTGLDRLLAGSVAEGVLRKARCPVLALRSSDARLGVSEEHPVILHPTDFSDRSEFALGVARALARERGARLVLLHVVPPAMTTADGMPIMLDLTGYRESLASTRDLIDGPDLKYPIEIRLAQGDATAEILRVARDVGCGLVVLGTHGRTGLSRFLMGSVAEQVLRGSPCPVLAVKAPVAASMPSPEPATV